MHFKIVITSVLQIILVLVILFLSLWGYSCCIDSSLSLYEAYSAILLFGAIGSPFFLSSAAISINLKNRFRWAPYILISLISTVVYGALIYLVYPFFQSAISRLIRPERLLAIVEVMIAGGFLMGLAHTLKNSGEKPS